MKILWISRHPMHGVQMGALRRLFGDSVELTTDSRPFDNVEAIVRRVREGGYGDCIAVVPLSVLAKMVDLGLKPLWSEAEQVGDRSRADWEVHGRFYRFVGFRRVERLVLEFSDLGPAAKRRADD